MFCPHGPEHVSYLAKETEYLGPRKVVCRMGPVARAERPLEVRHRTAHLDQDRLDAEGGCAGVEAAGLRIITN